MMDKDTLERCESLVRSILMTIADHYNDIGDGLTEEDIREIILDLKAHNVDLDECLEVIDFECNWLFNK